HLQELLRVAGRSIVTAGVAGVTPAQGSVKPTVGFTFNFHAVFSDFSAFSAFSARSELFASWLRSPRGTRSVLSPPLSPRTRGTTLLVVSTSINLRTAGESSRPRL